MWTVPALAITEVERTELERRVRAKTASQREAQRARIVLLAAAGVANRRIAAEVAMSEEYVGLWRRRFAEKRLEGLKDLKRSGRPRKYGHDERLRVVAAATAERPAFDSEWSHRLLAEYLSELGISASQVGRILAELDLKPHQVRGWLTRKEDPSFWERAADVCGLYLSPPTNAIVLSVDEKTAMSARSPKHPTKRARPGRPALKEFEYRRNGVASIVAALDVHSGQVRAEEITRNDAEHFIEFLASIDELTDPALAVHLILDNGSSHVAKRTKAWLAEHPRFQVHHTPKHASWLNQVELVFSILARRLLKRGEFSDRDDLVAKIMAWIANYDRTAKPFAWTYDGKPLKVA
jgi:transposase